MLHSHSSGASGPGERFPATSPLAQYPSPFAEVRVASVKDLLRRTYSKASDAVASAPTDRIGSNYTPTAVGLSMKALLQRLADPTIGAALLAGDNSSAKPRGNGPAISSARNGASNASVSVGLLGSPTNAGSAAASARPLRTFVVPRKTDRTLDQSKSSLGLSDGWTPLTEAQVEAAEQENEIARRYGWSDDRQRREVYAREVQAYWSAVERVMHDDQIAEHRAQWDDGIISRLAQSAAAHAGGAPGSGHGRRWVDPGLVVPVELMQRYGPLAFMPPPPSISPGDAVEQMFAEVYQVYTRAVKRAVLDYTLKHPLPDMHMGLTLHVVDATRYVRSAVTTRTSAGISYTAHQLAGLTLSRQLHNTEVVLLRLLDLWNGPRGAAAQSGPDGVIIDAYADTPLTFFNTHDFACGLPYTVDDFTGAVEGQVERALSTLKGQWHKEAAEIVASFVLELEENERVTMERAALAAATAAAPGTVKKPKNEDDSIVSALDPLYRDFARFSMALFLARQYAAGAAIGQEYANAAAVAAGEIVSQASATGRAVPTGTQLLSATATRTAGMNLNQVDPSDYRTPGASTLDVDEDLDAHAGLAPYDAVLSSIARAGMPTSGTADARSQQSSMQLSVTASRRGLGMTGAGSGAAGVHAAMLDPLLSKLAALTPDVLSSMTQRELRILILAVYQQLESKDIRQARRLQGAFNAAAVLMGSCLRKVVYRGIEDYSTFLHKYLPKSATSRNPSATDQDEKKDEDGFNAALSSSRPGGAYAYADASTPAAPLFRLTLNVTFGAGSTLVDDEHDEHGHGHAAGSRRGSVQGSGIASKPGSAGRRPSVSAGKKEGMSADEFAAAALDAAGADIADPHAPTAGDELRRTWAGAVTFNSDPTWDVIINTLTRNLKTLVLACGSMPRVEAEISAASGVATVAAASSPRANQGNGGAIEVAATAGGASARPHGVLDMMHGGGAISSVRVEDPSTGQQEDEAITTARRLILDVIAAGRPAADEIRSRFDQFAYLFGATEKKRLLAFVTDPKNGTDQFRIELEKLDKVAAAIAAICDDMVVLPLVQISAGPLKDALKARVRLLQTCIMRHFKASALHACEMLNVRYTRMSKKLLFKPATSEELVCLAEFAKSIDKDLHELEKSMFGRNGVAECVRLIHTDGLPREFQRQNNGSTISMGPAASASGSGTAASGRRSSISPTDNEGLPFTRSQSAVLKDALQWPDKISTDYVACCQVLDVEKQSLLDRLSFRCSEFQNELTDIRAGLEKLVNVGELRQTANTVSLVTGLTTRLEKAVEECDAINRQQALLEQPVTDFTTGIKEDQARIGPYDRLWQAVASFLASNKKWYSAPLQSNNAEDATKEAEGLKIAAVKVLRELPEEAANPRALATKIRDDLDRFLNADLPLLALLANPGLKDRHWHQMEGAVGFNIPHTPKSSLGDMLELHLEQHIAKIEEFCVTASKEYSLEKALDRMEAEWQPITLELKAYKTSGTHILSGASSDVVQALLDDHIVKSSTMAASRYAKALEGRIKEWVSALTEIQSVLDVWLKVQSTWLYLEPIFGSEDILQQMPVEGRKFKQVDEIWRAVVHGAVADTRALKALRQPGQLAGLTEAHENLELIQKGLNAYLESKRLIFPRFFFLSNDELLEILAETKDPTRVQPHLKKCFEGIDTLEFDTEQNITAMFSVESEKINFLPDPMIPGSKQINPADSKGNVEQWLLLVEAAMKRSVAKSVDDAMIAYPKAASRSQWAVEWPGQAVLAVTSTFWTHEVEQAIKASGSKGLLEYGKKCTQQIEDIIMKVRGKLTSLARKTLGALVVLDVHARDVTLQMGQNGVETIQDFDWNSQLRLYWSEGGESARTGKPASVTMKMINAVLQYAYEYLGNSSRLVITPLTDRCYRTLMGAIHLGLGGAPEGPAGTGKTETTKDLAKAVAIQCVVFNCSDGLDYIAMGKFFKGLASSGAWACFDEFNRIELEVLSVVAQQVLTIQRAVRERKERFFFEGTDLSLRWTCCAFITMNPGYAGRSELPDNLKALFRSVAMMVPDYAMISEILLYSYGYLEARPLARKIVATYKLCSEQLSSQDHYDYGMRAVMAVLRAAGNLKRAEGHLPEDVLVLRAIVDVNLPKFLAPDVPLFHAIVRDLFPGVVVPPPDRTRLVTAMQEGAHDLKVQLLPVVIEKVLQVYEMMIVRHGFMLVGMPWAGKTTAAKILQLSLASLHETYPDDPTYSDLIFVTLNPKSITMGQLYGQFDELTHEWTDGVLATKFRDCAQNKIGTPNDRKWVLFDGPVDAVWIENMNTVLDDNKKLCLTSGEIIAMTDKMSMVFEVADLAAASPATVSRCGMIYMEPQSLGWKPIVDSWLDQLMEDNPRFLFHPAHPNDAAAKARAEKEEKEYYEAADKAQEDEEASKKRGDEVKKKRTRASAVNPNDKRAFTIDAAMRAQIEGLCAWLIEPCLVLLRRQPLSEYCPTQDTTLVMTLLQVFEAAITQMVNGELAEGKPGYSVGSIKMKGKAEPTAVDIECFFVWSIVWSIGASINEEGRQIFTEFLIEATKASGVKYLTEHPLKEYFAIRGWIAPGTHANPPDAKHPNPYNSSEIAIKLELPAKGLVHDYFYAPVEGRWREWASCLPKEEIPAAANFGDIIVPTVYTGQFDYLVHLLVLAERRVLVCGPTGVGKSVYMKRMLLKALPKDTYVPVFVAFSARTTAKQTQSIMEQKLERRRKGVYGPPAGTKCIIFVDDLNMPEVEKYGAQPPLELLRQFADQGGWYDLAENQFKQMEDAFLVAAMGPPGGGRNSVSSRLLRHFNLLCFTDFNDDTMKHIFSTVMTWYMGKNSAYDGGVVRLGASVVAATLDVYKAASKGLRPTPAKSHYSFNLRDFSRVIEGLFMVSPTTAGTAPVFTRAWAHEVMRVFYDRLVTDDDRTWLLDSVKELTRKHFGTDFDELFGQLIAMRPNGVPAGPPATPGGKPSVTTEHLRVLMFGDYMAGPSSGPAAPRGYGEVSNVPVMAEKLEQFLSDYNAQSKKPMDLVTFLFFLEHVSRICRILKMPGGHALLVGVGGSGRRCSASLAAFINECAVLQIELSKSYGVTEWKDDLKRVLKEAGTGQQPVVFIFVDTQIKWEGMLEDVNAILNSGEVPGLFAPDERADICEKMSPFARAAGLPKDISAPELYAFFVERAKRNLHILLCMSPIGDAFRDRLRKFPSLVNCCTLDWFKSWPDDALVAVAHKSLKPLNLDATTANSVVDVCRYFHQSAASISDEYLQQARRYNYITPTSYLELLGAFKRALEAKRLEVSSARNRYVVGLEKLEFATQQVNTMQVELEALQPSLRVSQTETAELMKVIEARLPGVEETRAVVGKDAAIASAEAAKVGAVKAECEADLAAAMPILEGALKALDTITPNDITNIKSMQKPPENVKLVLSAVCVMLGEKPEKIPDPAGGNKKVDDYWGPSKKMLTDSKFIDRLKFYDLNNIDPARINAVRKGYVVNENFKPEIIAKASSAAEGMCRWCLAMDQYEKVAKEVEPKKAKLAEAESALAITMGELGVKQAQLKAVEDELATLQTQLDASKKKLIDLEFQVDLCQKKLARASQLIGGLGGEKVRWAAASADLGDKYNNLTGDVLLAAGSMAYLGVFTMEFRRRAMVSWVARCLEAKIPTTIGALAAAAAAADQASDDAEVANGSSEEEKKGEDDDGSGDAASSAAASSSRNQFSLAAVLGDPITIRQWQIDGLPTDSFSTDNGVIVSHARRWPLMIDPQGQANKWVRAMEKERGLIVCKLTDPGFLRTLENAIQFGRPVLLENVGEELDPALEPVLLKVVFKQGGVDCIRLGDATVEYDERFKLYITTKMRNPHYLPETSTKVSLVNFLLTPDGLTDQLVGIVSAQERPDLEAEKNRLTLQSAENNRTLKELEDKILFVLSNSSGNILEDESAIDILNNSKVLANEIDAKQKIAAETEALIDETRMGYTPVAQHASRLFFCIADMGALDPMYAYSLTWFNKLFIASIQQSKKSENLATRITNLNTHFTYNIYKSVCRSLFEKDKLLFAFLLTIAIMSGRGEVDPAEYMFLMTGGTVAENHHPNPAPAWLNDKSWGEFVRLSHLTAFDGLYKDVASHIGAWKKVYDSDAPHKADLPNKWGSMGYLTRMQKLLILRCIRPDKIVLAVQEFVGAQLGAKFLQPPPFDLKSCYDDSSCGQPLVFVLSAGSDPMAALLYFAEGVKAKVHAISLGQGQGPIAEAMIDKAKVEGGWVVLQNCHLAVSWMSTLERVTEQLAQAEAAGIAAAAGGSKPPPELTPPHPNFRLWLTSYPSASFPVSILQNGVKMTNEPPKGVRLNIKRSFLSDPISDPSFFASVANAELFRRMLFGLAFFHAIIQERRSFGPLGWNIPYEFNDSDLRISAMQLAMFLDDNDYRPASGSKATREELIHHVPYKHLRYLTGECNYGGKVTDGGDRITLMSLLSMVYCPELFEAAHPLSPSKEWSMPPPDVKEYKQLLEYIENGLPVTANPEVFGLHDNATISKDINEANKLFDSCLSTQSTTGGGGGGGNKKVKTKEESISEIASDILAKLRPEYDLEAVGARWPNDPKQSMNTVLIQELARYNRLIALIRSSLGNVQKAMKGLVVLSATLEGVANDLFLGRVPEYWKGRSFSSRKPLASYSVDLFDRLRMLDDWIEVGPPPIFWISGFFFTQSFLTGAAQNYARKYTIPIDDVVFDPECCPEAINKDSVKAGPEDGVYVYGMYLDGCRWNYAKGVLDESEPKILFAAAPTMLLRPCRTADVRKFNNYNCPLYKTSDRRGVLATTGHSSNFVMRIPMPSIQNEHHWIRRGVCMLLNLDN